MDKNQTKKKGPNGKEPVLPKGKKPSAKLSKMEKLESEIKELRASLADFEDRHLRLKAEWDNYRKRKNREIEGILRYEGAEVIKSFLPVVDDLERVIDSVDGNQSANVESVVEGMKMILEKLKGKLKSLQVEPFDSIGKVFDPELHDAMMVHASNDYGEQEVVNEFEKGYKYKDRIIRHAKVIINTCPTEQETAEHDKK